MFGISIAYARSRRYLRRVSKTSDLAGDFFIYVISRYGKILMDFRALFSSMLPFQFEKVKFAKGKSEPQNYSNSLWNCLCKNQ